MKFEVGDLQLQSDCTHEKSYWLTPEFLPIKKTILENSWGGGGKVTVFYALYSIRWAWLCVNAKMLIKLWKRLHAHTKYKPQYFPNGKIWVPENFIKMCYKKTEEVNEESTDEWLQCDACEAGFQHVTDIHCQHCHKTGRRQTGATAIRVEEEKVPIVSVTGCW